MKILGNIGFCRELLRKAAALVAFAVMLSAASATPVKGIHHPADSSVAANIRLFMNNGRYSKALFFPNTVAEFYNGREYAPNWVDPKYNTRQTWESMLLLDCVLQFGLSHADYHPQELLYDRLHDILERPEKVSNAEKARYDIFLTDAMITFINHLHFGKFNPVYPVARIDRQSETFNAALVLARAIKQKDFMSAILDVQPKSKAYGALQGQMHLLEGVYQEDCYEIPEADVRKIAINMERLRWAEVDADTYIEINIPSFTLALHQPDTVYYFKITAGKPSTPTPELQSELSYLTTAVAGKKVVKRPDKLTNESKTDIYQGSNAANRYGGEPDNRGSVFFWFDNSRGITMKSVALKRQTLANRARTDGTICVEDGEKLAALILKHDPDNLRAFKKAVGGKATRNFILKKVIPVRVTYVTCQMREGELIKYPDIYNKDPKLEEALYRGVKATALQ
ncbi:MAG TPA: L,D-transpeptidase family protein [Mucilaginibacter sp.]|nr:L,D-transpeptidase family protein [Mucilaginibacter sp.]